MADFLKAVKKTLDLEDGYSNRTSDYGGETKFGISKRSYPELDIKNLTIEEARTIYRNDYWDKLSLDRVKDQAAAEELFDTAVNCGWHTAAKFLQESLNLLIKVVSIDDYLKLDGLVGPATLDALNKYKHKTALLKTLNGLQFMRYYEIVKRDPGQKVNFRGWLKRIEY